jgi:probable rRNA maturation factor
MTDPPLRENRISGSAGGLNFGPLVYFVSCSTKHIGNKLVIFRKGIAGLSVATLERFVLRARRVIRLRGMVNVLVTNSSELRALNRRFRSADKATDVLSFPSPLVERSKATRLAGDVAISVDIARENAARLGHSVADEVKILTLHGILHLAGFDHERDHGEMAREESRLRRQLKLEAGLIERAQPQAGKVSAFAKRLNRAPGTRRRTA